MGNIFTLFAIGVSYCGLVYRIRWLTLEKPVANNFQIVLITMALKALVLSHTERVLARNSNLLA